MFLDFWFSMVLKNLAYAISPRCKCEFPVWMLLQVSDFAAELASYWVFL